MNGCAQPTKSLFFFFAYILYSLPPQLADASGAREEVEIQRLSLSGLLKMSLWGP